jgi:hypothetical protein
MRDVFVTLLVASLLIAPLLTGSVLISAYACYSKWQDSGFKSQYGFFQGCRVQLPSGVWIPAENIRELPLNK